MLLGESRIIDKTWGYEEIMANTKDYAGKLLHLKRQHVCSLHCHEEKDETFYCQSGLVLLRVEAKEFLFHPGQVVHVPPMEFHCFSGMKDSVMIEVSTTDGTEDNIRLNSSRKLDDDEFQLLCKIYKVE